MTTTKFFAIVAALFTMTNAHAQSVQPDTIKYSVRSAFLPAGFDNNDKVQFAIDGQMPSTCYKTGNVSVKVNKSTKTIEVRQNVLHYNTVCLNMMVPFHKIIDLGVMPVGDFTIVNEDGDQLGKLPIKETFNPAADDFMYAPAAESRVRVNEDGSQYVVVEGSFTNSCVQLKDLRIFKDGDRVVTVLPIAEQTAGTTCADGSFPFRQMAPLPKLANGRYMLHTRTMNGEALFRFFEVNNQ